MVHRRAVSRVTLCLVLFILPCPLLAQRTGAELHATLQDWAEFSWLQILDRNGGTGGRFSDLGILRRFEEDIDAEYQLDLLASRFTRAEDYRWYGIDNGFRWRAGSITKRDLATYSEFKTTVAVGAHWRMRVRFNREENPQADRSFLRVAFTRRWESGVFGVIAGSLDPLKPGSDIGIGVGWRDAEVPRREVKLDVTVLDWASDLIHLRLGAADQSQIDSTIEYSTQPIAFRVSGSTPLGKSFRVEGYAAVMRPSAVLWYRERNENDGLRQDERFGFVGGLVEGVVTRDFSAGIFATHIRARTERSALPQGSSVLEYNLIEKTTELGLFALAHVANPWDVELWLSRNWRPETRTHRDPAETDVDYLDRAWTGQLLLIRAPASGFTADVSLLMDRRTVVRGDGQVPSAGSLGQHNRRARIDLGWRFGDQMMFLIGFGMDLDPGEPAGGFGGARGRFTVSW